MWVTLLVQVQAVNQSDQLSIMVDGRHAKGNNSNKRVGGLVRVAKSHRFSSTPGVEDVVHCQSKLTSAIEHGRRV